jgi:hypothetical protein
MITGGTLANETSFFAFGLHCKSKLRALLVITGGALANEASFFAFGLHCNS